MLCQILSLLLISNWVGFLESAICRILLQGLRRKHWTAFRILLYHCHRIRLLLLKWFLCVTLCLTLDPRGLLLPLCIFSVLQIEQYILHFDVNTSPQKVHFYSHFERFVTPGHLVCFSLLPFPCVVSTNSAAPGWLLHILGGL